MIQILGFIYDFLNNVKLTYYKLFQPKINQELIAQFEEFDFFLDSIQCILVKHKSHIWVFSFSKIRFFDIYDKTPFFDKIFPGFTDYYKKMNPHLSKFMHWKYLKTFNEKQIISLSTRHMVIKCNINNTHCYNLSMLFDPFSTKVYILQNIYNSFSGNHKAAIITTAFEQKIKLSDFNNALFKKCQQIAYSPQDLALYFVDKK